MYKIQTEINDSEEEYKSTKTMIYKTYNTKGYFIENITNNETNEKLEIVLHTTPESFETIKQLLVTSCIIIVNEQELSYVLTKEERIAYFDNFNEKRILLNRPEAKNIKYYTWSEGNIESEQATIEG